jgi:hypothetical protein
MRYQVGAEELERVPSMAHRPDGTFRLVRSAPVGPTHAVAAASDAAACGIPARRLHLLFRLGPTAGSQVTQPRSVCPRTSRCNSSYTAAPYRTHGSRPFNPPVITDEASPFALRSTQILPRTAMHRRRQSPGGRGLRPMAPAFVPRTITRGALARDLPETALHVTSPRTTTQPSTAPLTCAVVW